MNGLVLEGATTDPRCPLTVLTGFLGAGKTTLLNRLLADPALQETAVVINEIGSIGLDHLLVGTTTEGVVLLGGGCLCCTLRGDLVDTLLDLAERRDRGAIPAFRRVVIETTGLADPGPVLQAPALHRGLATLYRLAGVVTLVDAVHGAATLDRHREAVRQAALADRLVITKVELAPPSTVIGLRERLVALNPTAPAIEVAAAGPALLLDLEQDGPASWPAAALSPGPRHRFTADDGGARTTTLTTPVPLTPGALDGFLDLVRARYGADLLRLKGLVALADDPGRPAVVQAVQHILHPLRRLPAWPDVDRRSRLVVITSGVDGGEIQRLFASFAGQPEIDTPDRQALMDNPLAF